jgi:hypothetical protein
VNPRASRDELLVAQHRPSGKRVLFVLPVVPEGAPLTDEELDALADVLGGS